MGAHFSADAETTTPNPEYVMIKIDAEHIALGMFLTIPDDELEAIIARARENAIARDKSGMDLLPRESQEALLREAYREIESEKEAAKRPPKFSSAELALIELEKAAFGKHASPENQCALVLHFQKSGMAPKEAAAKAAERAAAWGTTLGKRVFDSVTKKQGVERGRNPHKAALKEIEADAAAKSDKPKKRTDNASGGGGDNPWSARRWNVTKQGQTIRALGLDKAAAIAAAAGCKIGDTKPAKGNT
jgi:hypothetical protein